MPSEKIKRLVFERDSGICWHCGTDEGTTVHHRLNRGAGGDRTKEKTADRLSNLLTLCTYYNGIIESDLTHAREARERGIKLRMGMITTHTPVTNYDGSQWLLDDFGKAWELDTLDD
jgi:hypothetical protein